MARAPAGTRVPYRGSIDVDDKVAVALEGKVAVVVLAIVSSCVAAPGCVRGGAGSVFVDDEIAVCLEVEADAVVKADEGRANRFDVERVACCPGGVRVPFG